jgi:glycopeptide antibiotics resistance protein
MQKGSKNLSSRDVMEWFHLPESLFIRKFIPLAYLFFLQAITGIPKPDALDEFDASDFAIRFAEMLYDYPYWLQDLSHLPLFFVFTWMAHWFFGAAWSQNSYNLKAVAVSISYAVFNEGIQAIIPDRFPSPGDLFMNLAGVAAAAFVYSYMTKKLYTAES